MFVYKTQGVCSTEIHLDIQDNIIKDVQFIRGCQGNLMGISALVKNMNINDVIAKLKGIECGKKSSSCPDQLSKALEEYLKKAE
ncbi:MAG: TIGR03905 family TSCPD domain-containing protein [Clostridium sp.]|nr:TIGR03905 family TSCPD domain-containing protein [Clostridium sp.]MBS5948716.1 TIGR03905 family TSCPD domain-containing protein [Clostridium sp.]